MLIYKFASGTKKAFILIKRDESVTKELTDNLIENQIHPLNALFLNTCKCWCILHVYIRLSNAAYWLLILNLIYPMVWHSFFVLLWNAVSIKIIG